MFPWTFASHPKVMLIAGGHSLPVGLLLGGIASPSDRSASGWIILREPACCSTLYILKLGSFPLTSPASFVRQSHLRCISRVRSDSNTLSDNQVTIVAYAACRATSILRVTIKFYSEFAIYLRQLLFPTKVHVYWLMSRLRARRWVISFCPQSTLACSNSFCLLAQNQGSAATPPSTRHEEPLGVQIPSLTWLRIRSRGP